MKKVKHSITLLFMGLSVWVHGQQPERVREYIDRYKDLAMTEMQRTGVPAAIKLAQGIHETGAGTSSLVLRSNNHFGIKCKSSWTGESVKHDDDARAECFRKYPSPEDSYRDHSDFLKNSARYASLFDLDPADYAGWAHGLKKAGYATNPRYPLVLIRLIEEYQLQDYSLLVLGKTQEEGHTIAQADTAVDKPADLVLTQKAESDEEMIPGKKYPEGPFTINETKVVYVRKGTPFIRLAQQYAVPLARIFEFNELEESETTDKDQLIYIQRKRKTGSGDYHIVQPGETLHGIAQANGIRLESLLDLNWLNKNDRPAPGEKLSLKKKSPSRPRLAIKSNYSLWQAGPAKQ